MGRKSHWDTVYLTRQPDEVGWTQEIPKPSLKMIRELSLPKTSSIIDIGGGDSHLVKFLLEDGFSDITVLDISAPGIERAKKRLGADAEKIKWIVTDIINFKPDRSYDLWHDRAAFHFLTEKDQIDKYVDLSSETVNEYLTIGTFSTAGPEKCSGLNIRQYDENLLATSFSQGFDIISTFREDHITPGGNTQNFIFAILKKKKGI